MDNKDIAELIMWAAGIQTTLILGALGFIWSNLNKRISEVKADLSKKDDDVVAKLSEITTKTDRMIDKFSGALHQVRDELIRKVEHVDQKVDTLTHTTSDIDKRLYGIETVLHMKDCCVLKQDQNLKKAE